MSGDQLDLDAIERRANATWAANTPALMAAAVVIRKGQQDSRDLVAEVRRLRAIVESLEGFPFTEQRAWTE